MTTHFCSLWSKPLLSVDLHAKSIRISFSILFLSEKSEEISLISPAIGDNCRYLIYWRVPCPVYSDTDVAMIVSVRQFYVCCRQVTQVKPTIRTFRGTEILLHDNGTLCDGTGNRIIIPNMDICHISGNVLITIISLFQFENFRMKKKQIV